MENMLICGDNLEMLQKWIKDESVDLIYLDPPFNSDATYNVLFREKTGEKSPAQIKAFEDTWEWDYAAEGTYHNLVTGGPPKVADLIQALRAFLGTNDMMAYLVMMAVRLLELRRVLNPAGSIYLHCDPGASHYLKLLLDAVFGYENFRNEIVWGYRTGGVSKKHFARKHDVILYYSRDEDYKFNVQYYRSYQMKRYNYSEKYPEYFDEEKEQWYHQAVCRDVWDDIPAIGTDNKERLGYPTQKPEALLERIIRASSSESDTVLDPFCGCGTTINVAERLKRHWIGIDITHLAISLIKHRLADTFRQNLTLYTEEGSPKDLPSAKALADQDRRDKTNKFEQWAVGLVNAMPYKLRGADSGIDGFISFFDDDTTKAKKIVIQVKSGHVDVSQIRDLKGVMDREKAEIGAFITLEPETGPMRKEAVSTGFYEPPNQPSLKCPRVQILTIEALLGGAKLLYHSLSGHTFQRAKAKEKIRTDEKPLDL